VFILEISANLFTFSNISDPDQRGSNKKRSHFQIVPTLIRGAPIGALWSGSELFEKRSLYSGLQRQSKFRLETCTTIDKK